MSVNPVFGDPARVDTLMWRSSLRIMEERSYERGDQVTWNAGQLAGLVLSAHEPDSDPCPDCDEGDPCSALLHAESLVLSWLQQETTR